MEGRILIVNNEEMILSVLSRKPFREGYSSVTARNWTIRPEDPGDLHGRESTNCNPREESNAKYQKPKVRKKCQMTKFILQKSWFI